MIKYCNKFDFFKNDPTSAVFEIFPKIFDDNRGSFSEVLKTIGNWPYENYPIWFTNLKWIKQINRSKSSSGVIRGMHGQKAPFCQGKLVEALTESVYDVIIDARPDSKTFGVSDVFKLDSTLQNKLWVPIGFLHGFIVPLNCKQEIIFNYYCSNVYNKESDFGVCPTTVLPIIVNLIKDLPDYQDFNAVFDLFDQPDKMLFSEKDKNNQQYEDFMNNIMLDYQQNGKLWYK